MRVLISITVLLLLCLPAQARRHHQVVTTSTTFTTYCAAEGCGATYPAAQPAGRTSGVREWARGVGHGARAGSGSVVAHPAGCPARAFCGCGASLRVFGRTVRNLYLAANWLRFPRAAPAPGMVAARRGHVFVLESHVDGSTWIVYDANSGGRQTRIHARSIAGYSIVNPHA